MILSEPKSRTKIGEYQPLLAVIVSEAFAATTTGTPGSNRNVSVEFTTIEFDGMSGAQLPTLTVGPVTVLMQP